MPLRGKILTLIINELQLLTTTMADMTHDCNFYQVLTSHIVISSVDASLSGHVQSRKTAPIDFMTLAARWMISPYHTKQTVQLHVAGCTHLLEPHACTTIPYCWAFIADRWNRLLLFPNALSFVCVNLYHDYFVLRYRIPVRRKFIMGVNLRLIRTKLKEERESPYETRKGSSLPGERVLCRSASLIVVIARK